MGGPRDTPAETHSAAWLQLKPKGIGQLLAIWVWAG